MPRCSRPSRTWSIGSTRWALAHKRFYELSQLTQFDLTDYVRELVADILIGAAGRTISPWTCNSARS